jgi:hypothetical protein
VLHLVIEPALLFFQSNGFFCVTVS